MAQPTRYERSHNFQAVQDSGPGGVFPANLVNTELDALEVTTDEICDNLALIQRDDGELANRTVGQDQLKDEIAIGFNPSTVWATATAYTVNDYVTINGSLYRCDVAHTSGTFATDLAADKWAVIVDTADAVNAGLTTYLEEETLSAPALQNILPQIKGDNIDLMLFTQGGVRPSRTGTNGDETVNNAAFLDAIAAAAEQVDLNSTFGSAVVQIPSGVFRIDDTIEVAQDRTVLAGKGSGATVIVMDDNTKHAIKFGGTAGSANAIFKSGLQGVHITRVGESPDANDPTDPANIRIENIKEGLFFDFFVTNYGNGVSIDYAANCRFSHFNIHGTSNRGATAGVGKKGFAAFAFTASDAQAGECTGNYLDMFEIQNATVDETSAALYGLLVRCADGLYLSNGHLHKCDELMAILPDGDDHQSTVGGVFVNRVYFDANFKYGVNVGGTNVIGAGPSTGSYGGIHFGLCRFSGAAEWGVNINVDSGAEVTSLRFLNCFWRGNVIGGLRCNNERVRGLQVVEYDMFNNNTSNDSSGRDILLRGNDYRIIGRHYSGGASGTALQIGATAGAGTIDADLSPSTMTKLSLPASNNINGRQWKFREHSDGYSRCERTIKFQTTDATATVVWSLGTAAGWGGVIEVDLVAHKSDKSLVYNYRRVITFKRVTSSVELEDDTAVFEMEDSDDANPSFAVGLSGTTIQATWTGVAATTFDGELRVVYKIRS